MKRMVLWSVFMIILSTGAQAKTTSPLVERINRIFGPQGLAIDQKIFKEFQEKLPKLESLSHAEIITTLECVINALNQRRELVHTKLSTALPADKEFLFLEQFVLDHTLHFYITLYQHYQNASITARLQKSLSDTFKHLQSWIFPDASCSAHEPSDSIIHFLDFERNEIINSYDQLQHYFVLLEKNPLPDLLGLWKDSSLRYKVAQRSRALHNTSARLQFLGSLAEAVGTGLANIAKEAGPLALQAALMSGGSMYNQWLSQEAQEEFARLAAEQQQLATDFSNFLNNLQEQRKKLVQNILQQFVQAQKDITVNSNAIFKQQQDEYLYLMRSISLDLPRTRYLTDPISFDQLFQASRMLTPSNQPQWYNLYQAGAGDWEFDEATHAFWQRMLIPFGKPYWTPFNGNDNPGYNAIFTEYIAKDNPLVITIDCTLIACTYPFFVGILFNRGRWISGDPERIAQYRLLGLYGTQLQQGSTPPISRIDLAYAQQKIDIASKRIITPLEQISNTPTTHLFQLPADMPQTLIKTPLEFRFEVNVFPESLTYRLSQKDTKGQLTLLTNGTLANLENYLAIFNGIGFMATGCQAAFTIIEPQSLRYSNDQITQFATIMKQRTATAPAS